MSKGKKRKRLRRNVRIPIYHVWMFAMSYIFAVLLTVSSKLRGGPGAQWPPRDQSAISNTKEADDARWSVKNTMQRQTVCVPHDRTRKAPATRPRQHVYLLFGIIRGNLLWVCPSATFRDFAGDRVLRWGGCFVTSRSTHQSAASSGIWTMN